MVVFIINFFYAYKDSRKRVTMQVEVLMLGNFAHTEMDMTTNK